MGQDREAEQHWHRDPKPDRETAPDGELRLRILRQAQRDLPTPGRRRVSVTLGRVAESSASSRHRVRSSQGVVGTMESTPHDNAPGLIARYGQLHDEELADRERADRLVGLVVDLLRESGADARQTWGGLTSRPAIALALDGVAYLIDVTWSTGPTTPEEVAPFARDAAGRHGIRSVLLSLSGFASDASQYLGTQGNLGIVLLDRAHLEAVLCGLVTPQAMLQEAARRALFDLSPYTGLTDLLVDRARLPDPPPFVTPDRSPRLAGLVARAAPGVQAQLVLAGDRGWGEPLGFGVVDDARVLVTTADGIVEVDLKRGGTGWALPLAGCRGAPLVRPDGAVLALCNDAVVGWKDGVVTPLAGGFGDARALLTGPAGEPWVLSGYGPAFGTGTGTLALTRLGARPGRQQRYSVRFDADVRTAGWLAGLRFFLAAAGHSAVVDLARSSAVRDQDRIEMPHPSPGHLVVVDPQTVITASPDPGGVHATIYRTDLVSRTSDLVCELATNRVHGLAAGPGGHLLLLGDVRGNAVLVPHPVLVRVTFERRPAVPEGAAAAGVPAGGPVDPDDAVRLAARGSRRDYALDPKPIAKGGQATVFAATHKPSGVRVAFKKLNAHGEDNLARMRREIEAARLFGGHLHVMPVLDFSPAHDWFVMPLASDSAQTLAAALHDPRQLRTLITAICDALQEPHALGWIHRDLKPDNLLKREGRWVVVDWGLGRRPHGQTSDPRRTRVGGPFGTEGFAAPELSVNAHEVGPQADVYSIGQIVGWALTGSWPQANVPLLPPPGPWRNVVKAATFHDPGRRPATVDQLLALVTSELDGPPEVAASRGEQLLTAARGGDQDALRQLFHLAARHPADFDLYMDVVVNLDADEVRRAVSTDPATAREVVRAMTELHSGGQVTMEYRDVDRLITWLLVVAYHAEAIQEWDLLEDCADTILFWDQWDRWRVQRDIRSWLAARSGHAAAVVAAVLRRHHDVHAHFEELANDRRVDRRIRQALSGTR
jgi:serine/threonine protein kinase